MPDTSESNSDGELKKKDESNLIRICKWDRYLIKFVNGLVNACKCICAVGLVVAGVVTCMTPVGGLLLEIAGNLTSIPAPSTLASGGDALGGVVAGAAHAVKSTAKAVEKKMSWADKKKLYDTIKNHIKLAREHHTKITGTFGMQRRKSGYDAAGFGTWSTGVQKKLTDAKQKVDHHIREAEGHLKRLCAGSTDKVLQKELTKLKEDHSRVSKQ